MPTYHCTPRAVHNLRSTTNGIRPDLESQDPCDAPRDVPHWRVAPIHRTDDFGGAA